MLRTFEKHKKPLAVAAVIVLLAACLTLTWFSFNAAEQGRNPVAAAMEKESASFFAAERDLSALARDVQTGAAGSVGLSPQFALVSRVDGERYYVRTDNQRALVAELLKANLAGTAVVFSIADVEPPAPPLTLLSRNLTSTLIISLLGPLLVVFMLLQMNPARGAGGVFKTTAKPDTRFTDVIGVEEAKEALEDIVAYLRNPAKFSELGANPPKGVVLEGHFGAGKTLLARAVAGEAGVPFVALAGGDFSDMFLGIGVRRVRKLFALARSLAPCVIFIDEIDGLGRRASGNSAGETENNRIINTLLVELDGFTSTSGIVVLGATNNLANLDPALVRPGRFDRTCNLGLPDVDEREKLFALYVAKLRTDGIHDHRQLARLASGLSPASIANAVNSAALLAAKEGAKAVTHEHLHRVLEQHLMGGPSTGGQAALTLAERERIAVHEAGHALIARLLNVGVVEKVSILKRGRALGATLVTNNQNVTLMSEPELRSTMTMLLGGRGAEALILKTASTGAANDLERVSSMAYRMVTEFGFSKKIGPFSYAGLPYGERRRECYPEAVEEAREIIKDVERQCAEILVRNRHALERLTAQLLEHETVSGEIVDECLGTARTSGALAA